MILLVALFTQFAWGAEAPTWVNRPPSSDGTYNYYVGRSTDEKSLSQAWRAATQDAYETAIRENYGVATSIQASNYETMTSRQLDKRVDEKSQRVRLERFEQMNSHVDRHDSSIDLYLLFRYPVSEIEKEKQRLAADVDLPDAELTEIGENSSSVTTQVRIESVPNGADVFINDNRWGVTPLLIKGVLPVGVYDFSIRHSQFQDVSEKLILIAGKEKSIRKVLQPAQGVLRIEPVPSNAQVTVNGKIIGIGKSDSVVVPAGKDLKIEVSHPDYETMIRVVKIAKNEDRTVRLELPLLPERQAKLEKEVELESAKSSRSFWSDSDWYQNTWIWGLGFEVSEPSAPYPFGQSTLGIGLSVEKRFFYRFGVRGKFMLDSAFESPSGTNSSSSSSSSENAIYGASFSLGMPIYLSGDSSSIYVMPEVGRIQRKVPDSYYTSNPPPQNSSSQKIKSFSYPRSGVTLGYQDLEHHYDVWVSYHVYTWENDVKHSAWLVGVSYSFGTRQPKNGP